MARISPTTLYCSYVLPRVMRREINLMLDTLRFYTLHTSILGSAKFGAAYYSYAEVFHGDGLMRQPLCHHHIVVTNSH